MTVALRAAFWAPVLTAYCLLVPPQDTHAQEVLRTSVADAAAVRPDAQTSDSLPCTVRVGDLRLLLTPSLELDYNDNIDLQSRGGLDDWILRPTLRALLRYPVTERNLVFLDLGLGYDDYLRHANYSRWRLSSESQASFDMYIGDTWINVHDRFSSQQDSARDASLAATGVYGTFENTVGVAVLWELNQLTLTAGYDHHNTLALEESYASQDRATELWLARAGVQCQPDLATGMESTLAMTRYRETYLNDNLACSVGVFAEWKPGHAIRFLPRAGYAFYNFRNTSHVVETEDVQGSYADLSIEHALSEAVRHSLTGGHQFRLGVQSDIVEDWHASYRVSWQALGHMTLNLDLAYEHGEQALESSSASGGAVAEVYDWASAGVGFDWPLMRHCKLGIHYRVSHRASDLADRDYWQNVIGLTVTYQ